MNVYLWITIFILILVLIGLLFYNRSVRLEQRLKKYTVQSLNNKGLSLFDKIGNKYNLFIKNLSKILSHSTLLTKYSTKYNKYCHAFNVDTEVNFISNKIVVGLIFIVFTIFIKLIRFDYINIYELLLSFILGYYVIDAIYLYKYKQYQKNLENDLLEAVIIMNNSFKAGSSITQAMQIVEKELSGSIALEFKKMNEELAFGLSIDVVFERFSTRINIDEVNYIASSISIVNKTGGNIIKIFSSIEKTLMGKKKLKAELKSLTSNSRMMTYILIGLPVFFVFIISLMDMNYFKPLFTNVFGIALALLIIILYVMYIYIVRKVMKLRMWFNEIYSIVY